MNARTVLSVVGSVALIGAALVAVFLSFGFNRPGATAPESGSPPADGTVDSRAEPARVTVTQARRATLIGTVRLNGQVEAANRVKVYPDVGGTVGRIEVTEGQYVALDQPLLYIDPSRPGAEFQDSPVRAPIAGTVVSIDVERGAEVQAAMALVTVSSLDRLRVDIEIPERYASRVERGMSATFESFALRNGEYRGVVVSVEPTIDPASRSKRVEVRVDGSRDGLEPGMFVSVGLPLDRAEGVVAVPFRALIQEGGNEYVYTVEDGAARRVAVRTGIIAQDRVEVVSGLDAGQAVVTEGHQELRPGRPVRVIEEEPSQGGAGE
ncbi:MAG: efflux RND transporter periplasmic adaptor subunit [Spirochaetes bacterium]|jgi:multidrug efflux pump subunit AcrA (membrane-fusion protein)|nr:efflux RND transporter periplasmic adaptor subunit [Spirochaetota bacterium]